MAIRIGLDDWQAVVEQLRGFGENGTVTEDDDRIRIEFGAAHLEVSRDGHVSTGMPLHDFEHVGAVDLVVDHDAGTVTFDAGDVRYTFRRPGG